MLSSDGGGFFNANSAHPFENPTAATNFLEMVLIFVIGAGLTNTFGRMIGNERQGWALLAAMGILYAAGVAGVYAAEARGNPALAALGINQSPSGLQAGGNMEGKEVRFGTAMSSLFATVTTDSSSGAVNAMHDGFTPLGGGVLMANMMLDEVIVGGVGSGLFGMLLFAVVAVFVAGLMIGRTPEFVGKKKITATEVKMTTRAALRAARHPWPNGDGERHRAGLGELRECRPARLFGDPLRLHLRYRIVTRADRRAGDDAGRTVVLRAVAFMKS
jgi:K+-transporting ATPase ATPase A chain